MGKTETVEWVRGEDTSKILATLGRLNDGHWVVAVTEDGTQVDGPVDLAPGGRYWFPGIIQYLNRGKEIFERWVRITISGVPVVEPQCPVPDRPESLGNDGLSRLTAAIDAEEEVTFVVEADAIVLFSGSPQAVWRDGDRLALGFGGVKVLCSEWHGHLIRG